jgi:hypothetical protein
LHESQQDAARLSRRGIFFAQSKGEIADSRTAFSKAETMVFVTMKIASKIPVVYTPADT